jgi:hypothetical protein
MRSGKNQPLIHVIAIFIILTLRRKNDKTILIADKSMPISVTGHFDP